MAPTTSSDSFVGPDLVLEGTITGEGNFRAPDMGVRIYATPSKTQDLEHQ